MVTKKELEAKIRIIKDMQQMIHTKNEYISDLLNRLNLNRKKKKKFWFWVFSPFWAVIIFLVTVVFSVELFWAVSKDCYYFLAYGKDSYETVEIIHPKLKKSDEEETATISLN